MRERLFRLLSIRLSFLKDYRLINSDEIELRSGDFMPNYLKRLVLETKGTVAMSVGILAVPLLMISALSVDYMIYSNQRSELQAAADAAALASVKELSLNGAKTAAIQAAADQYANVTFYSDEEINRKSAGTLSVTATPNFEINEVTVELSYEWAPFMAHLMSRDVTPIVTSATAGLSGDSVTCVIGLMEPQRLAKASIHMDDSSEVEATGCAIFSNSTSKYGLRADKRATMTAATICSAGGVLEFGIGTEFTPTPITDCPKIEDPLAARPGPSIGACRATNLEVTSDTVLAPGTYCGGIAIRGNATVTLSPGTFVIHEGPFHVHDTATLVGTGITLAFTGQDSEFEFGADTVINISAPDDGPMAGLLMYEDRNVPHSFDFNPLRLDEIPDAVRVHTISSNQARNLLGTIYLPKSILLIDANSAVADASAYTALIVGRLWLQEGPTLTINSNYTDTTVPVPDSLIATQPALVR